MYSLPFSLFNAALSILFVFGAMAKSSNGSDSSSSSRFDDERKEAAAAGAQAQPPPPRPELLHEVEDAQARLQV